MGSLSITRGLLILSSKRSNRASRVLQSRENDTQLVITKNYKQKRINALTKFIWLEKCLLLMPLMYFNVFNASKMLNGSRGICATPQQCLPGLLSIFISFVFYFSFFFSLFFKHRFCFKILYGWKLITCAYLFSHIYL